MMNKKALLETLWGLKKNYLGVFFKLSLLHMVS